MNKSGIIVLGNYSPSGHDASRIVDENGVALTVKGKSWNSYCGSNKGERANE